VFFFFFSFFFFLFFLDTKLKTQLQENNQNTTKMGEPAQPKWRGEWDYAADTNRVIGKGLKPLFILVGKPEDALEIDEEMLREA
jgi:hypothetical protein